MQGQQVRAGRAGQQGREGQAGGSPELDRFPGSRSSEKSSGVQLAHDGTDRNSVTKLEAPKGKDTAWSSFFDGLRARMCVQEFGETQSC